MIEKRKGESQKDYEARKKRVRRTRLGVNFSPIRVGGHGGIVGGGAGGQLPNLIPNGYFETPTIEDFIITPDTFGTQYKIEYNQGYIEFINAINANIRTETNTFLEIGKTYDFIIDMYDYDGQYNGAVKIHAGSGISPAFQGDGIHTFRITLTALYSGYPRLQPNGSQTICKIRSFRAVEVV